jgi:acylglycerol lipase
MTETCEKVSIFSNHSTRRFKTSYPQMVEIGDAKFDIDYDGTDFTIPLTDSITLLGQTWAPAGDPRYVYIFAHGLGAFVPFKKDFFYVVLEQQGVVFACDHLGHGRSPGTRTAVTVEELVNETRKVVLLAHERYPNLPIILHGHSMGGLAVLSTSYQHSEELRAANLKGVIAECPWISPCPSRPVGWLEHSALWVMRWVLPSVQLPAGVELFTPDLNETWVRLCQESPAYSHTITPKLVMSVEPAQQFIHANVATWPANLPLLFLQGASDPLVDPVANLQWGDAVAARPDVRVTTKRYENATHVLLKCPCRGEVVRDILAFIDASIV